jgi:class 3 adenylate cyclase/tetratricopeptide (TPR) repeat protein
MAMYPLASLEITKHKAMTSNLQDTVKQLEQAISDLEKQRETLDAATVEAAISSMRQKLAELEGQPVSTTQQRKLATILYADVVGSTNLSQPLEPDEVLDIMDRALKRLAEPVEVHGGHVTRFQGDGFKAVFGLPLAHENDPEQAVRSGLEILELAQEIAQEWQDQLGIPNFQVRVGINTGMVAAGGETEAEDTVMGRAVNLAARLESAAPPGGLLISHFTYQHVRGVFDMAILSPIQAKGFDASVAVYLVKQAKPRSFRVLSRGVEGVETRMVGREAELKYLQDTLLTAMEEEEGQVVTISGEAGVGKSRLIFEFQNWFELLPQAVRLYQGQAKLETQNIPFSLLRDMFTYRFQIQDSDPPQLVREKIEHGVEAEFRERHLARIDKSGGLEDQILGIGQPGFDGMAHAHFIGQLLGFDFSESPYIMELGDDPQAQRNRGMSSLRDYFAAASQAAPVVVFLDDVHWADDSSIDVIKELSRMTAKHPILLICLARPSLYERRPYWGEGQEFHRKMELQPLSKRESRQLVEEILKHVEHVPLELRELVVAGAEGNPFYIEELIKMLIERGVIVRGEINSNGEERWRVIQAQLELVDVPTTLAGVLQARLDSLVEDEKRILQQAAVVGRTFWDRVVEHIHTQTNGKANGQNVSEVLKRLREKELIFRREDSAIDGAQEYIFKHDVLREVTYDTVLVKERRVYHGLVADWLLANIQQRMREYYGLVGEHLRLAGRVEQAVRYFLRAGDQALGNYANTEAQEYYQRGLELEPEEGVSLSLLTGIGRAYSREGMYEQAMAKWEKGIEICRKQGDLEGMAHLYTLAMGAANPLQPEQAMKICQDALPLVERLQESSVLAHLLHQVGRTYRFNGMDADARRYCQLALELGEKLSDKAVQADTLATIAILTDMSPEDALQTLTRAEKLAESQQLMYILGRSRHNLSEVTFHSFGDLETSHSLALKAAEVVRMRGDIEWELSALNSAANIRLEMGNFERAKVLLDHIENRLNSYPILDWIQQVSLSWWGLYQTFRGDWSSALETIYQVMKYAKLEKNRRHLFDPIFLSLLPVSLEVDRFYKRQNWVEIEATLRKVLDIPGEILNPAAYSLMSMVFSRQGDFDKAEQWLLEASHRTQASLVFTNRRYFKKAKIELAVAKKEWTTAMNELEKFVEFVEHYGFRWEQARALLELGDVYVSLNAEEDFNRAQSRYRKSLDMFSDMGADGYVEVVKERLHDLGSLGKINP